MSEPEDLDREPAPLAAGPRALTLAAAWGAFALSSPGVLAPDGVAPLALVALFAWSAAATRPGPRAFAIEWVAAALALGGLMHWLGYISPFVVPPTGIGKGLYMAAAGALARALARRLPLALAGPLAWTSLETLRDLLEPPFGMGWVRLAHCAVDVPLLVESARVWGPAGVSFAVAAAGAGLAGALAEARAGRRPRALLELGLGAAPAALGVALALAVPAPATEPGPVVLLVQPNVSQARKQSGLDPQEVMREQVILSRRGQAEAPVDLVVWSETMVRIEIADEGLAEAVAAGARFDPWQTWRGDEAEYVALLERFEDTFVRDWIFGDSIGGFAGGAAVRPGTAFLGGTEEWRADGDRLRRYNVGALWTEAGERSTAAKTHLVPLGEWTFGLERFGLVRAWIDAMAGYTPDFASAPTGSVAFADRAGRTWRVGIAICFDNAFVEAFAGAVDFHVVLSNEAWYRRSIELDQMLAFTRLAAVASGRSIARCTNSGVSAIVDPRGVVVERLTVGGDDREVAGTLRGAVPVPSDPASTTLFLAFRPLWRSAWVLLGFVALAVPRRRGDLSGADGDPAGAGR